MQTQSLIMQIDLKGFSFTVMEKLLLFGESFSFWGVLGVKKPVNSTTVLGN